MPFNKPTPTDIKQRLQSEVDIALVGADARLRRSVEAVLVAMLTMTEREMYGYLDWISKQILVSTCDDEELDKHGKEQGVVRNPATAATGTVIFTGTSDAIIPAGAILKRGDGAQYMLAADVTLVAGTGNGTVTAAVASADGDAAAASKLTMVSPVAGVKGTVTVGDDGLSGGADVEPDADYRARILAYLQSRPMGGNSDDYQEWAKEISGVTRVWVYPRQLGIGTVLVMFVMDNKADTIIPTDIEVASVQSHINSVAPGTADVTVVAPTPVNVDLEIHLNPNTDVVRAAVNAELADFFKRESVPGGTIYKSRLDEAVSAAAGEFDHIIVGGANIVRAFGEISMLGNITFGDM